MSSSAAGSAAAQQRDDDEEMHDEMEDELLSKPAEKVKIERHITEDDDDVEEVGDENTYQRPSGSSGAAGKRPRASDSGAGRSSKQMVSANRTGSKVLTGKERRAQEVERQLAALRQEQARAQKSRLRFLLGQSDLFRHFLEEGGVAQSTEDVAALMASPQKGKGTAAAPGKHRGRPAGKGRGKAEDEGEEGEGAEDGLKPTTRLLVQPSCITGATMRDYQLEGLNWLISLHENGLNGILADEMGLGKTLQSISLLAWCWEALKDDGPHLVLVPKSTLSNWEREFTRFVPGMKTLILQSDKGKEFREETVRTRLLPGMTYEERGWHALLTTYECACIEEGPLSRIPWKYIVIDEAHRIKNENTTLAQAVRSFTSGHRLLITGTPLQNNLHELWALLNFLLPDVFGSSAAFDSWFDLANNNKDEEAKAAVVRQLHRILRPFMLRRLKSEVAKTLPPKTETVLYCGFTRMQKELYRGLLMRNIDAVISTHGGTHGGKSGGDKTRLSNLVMHLRKACCHPYLFDGVEDRSLPALGEHLVEASSKLRLLDKLLPKLKERGSRVLIFSQFKIMLDILEDYCHLRRYGYCRIDGSTSYDEREEGIDAFNAPGSSKFVFLLSTRAGGLGINLATADIVILYDSDWNPQMDLQAMDRAHRIGQTKPVKVYRLVTNGSVEEKIIERAWVKLKMDAVVVQSGRLADSSTKLSKEDMMEMVQFGATAIFGKGEGGGLGAGEGGEDELAAIDAILEEGEARTKALSDAVNAKVGNKGKGLLDFTFDGGMGTQTFEGVDYKNEQQRKKALEDAALALKLQVAEAMAEQSAAERAARKAAVLSYNEGQIFKALQVAEGEGGGGGGSKSSKSQYFKLRALLPLEHRPPKRMDAWQLYDSARIMEITAQEIAWVQARHEAAFFSHAQPPSTVFGGIDPSQPFPVDLILERSQLLQEAYPDWRKPDFDAYCMAVKTFGRGDAASIARMLAPRGKGRAEVLRYHRDFWVRGKGKQCLANAAYNSLEKSVEKGEASIREIKQYEQSLTLRTARTQKGWNPNASSATTMPAFGTPAALASDPWRNLEIPAKERVLAASTASAAQSRLWTSEADRYILASVARLGHGKYDLLRAAILHEPRFRFDHWLRCRTESDLESRAKALLKALDKELPEQLRREDLHERMHAVEEAAVQRRKAYDAQVAKLSAERLLASVRYDAETTAQRDAQLLAKKAEADRKKAAEREAKEREKAAADAAKRAAMEAALGAGGSSTSASAAGSKSAAAGNIKGKHLAPTLVPPEYFPSIATFLKSCKAKTAEDAAGDYLRWYTSNNPTNIPAGQPGAMPKLPAKAQVMYLLEVVANRHKEPYVKTTTLPAPGAAAGSGKTREYSVTAYKYTWSWKSEYSQYAGVSSAQAAAEYAKLLAGSGPIMVTMMSYASASAGGEAGKKAAGSGGASASPAQSQSSSSKPTSGSKEEEEVVEMGSEGTGAEGGHTSQGANGDVASGGGDME